MVNIIPAIDIISGECVRLSKGKFSTKKVYSSSPVEVAKVYSDLGCRRLHIVDLDGARSNHPENLKILEQIASVTQMDIQFGGGIKDENSLISALDAGASRVICGSVAIYDPELFVEWLNKYGSQRVILGADFMGEKICVDGWKNETDYTLDDTVEKFYKKGLKQLIATDISKDGMLSIPEFYKYYKLKELFPELEITVSGGISSIEDIMGIESDKIDSVIVGKAIYEGKINPEELRRCWQIE